MDILTVNDRPGQYPASYYAATASFLPPFATAEGDISCDVCVVGGGYAGLSAALHLAEQGLDVVLLEAHRVGFGASGRNGGQVGTGQRVGQEDLEKAVGMARAQQLWDMSLDSVALVRELIARHRISCGWADGIIEADHRKRDVAGSHAHAEHMNKIYDYHLIRALSSQEIRDLVGSNDYHGGTLDMGGGHLHPLNYALGLARAAQAAGVRIFENSRVVRLKAGCPARLATQTAQVTADHVALAMNGYHGDLVPPLGRRIMPINNFIVATAPLGEQAKTIIRDNHAVADSRFVINYFRLSQDQRLLFGGGESYGYRFPRDIAAVVRKPMRKVFPQLREVRIDYAWGGTLGITRSRMPSFLRLNGNILSIGGFSGHGVAMATLAGKILADGIAGQAGRFDLMADLPAPDFPGGTVLRWPLLVLAMSWYALRDRL